MSDRVTSSAAGVAATVSACRPTAVWRRAVARRFALRSSRKKSSAAALLLLLFACGERDITIGSDKDTGGNYWGRNVCEQFGESQLRTLYQAMNSAATAAEVSTLNCSKKLPRHEYSVTLWTEGKYRERLVRLQMTPRLYENDECLQESVNYVFQKMVKAIDTGPPIDYGYKNPMTGKHLDTSEITARVPPKPSCPCPK